jgi:hypothetical protein
MVILRVTSIMRGQKGNTMVICSITRPSHEEFVLKKNYTLYFIVIPASFYVNVALSIHY